MQRKHSLRLVTLRDSRIKFGIGATRHGYIFRQGGPAMPRKAQAEYSFVKRCGFWARTVHSSERVYIRCVKTRQALIASAKKMRIHCQSTERETFGSNPLIGEFYKKRYRRGNALYEHLSKLGYTDFETVPVSKRTDFKQENCLNIDIKNIVKKIYTKLFSLYSWITQEKNNSEKQLRVILNAEALLNDHFSVINSFITKCNNNSIKRITLQELIMAGVVLVSSTYISWCKYKILPTLFASFAICCVGYMKYLRFYTKRNLEHIILSQNELFLICKDGLKILQRDYKMKLDSGSCLQQFS
ncbi:hypothetical protein ALC56_14734 [Trachymyrmex septentrionalis]|uniref:Uncharacterized protein n=1 Tax=Trachymyrmex septentrionalis TaxID=34720 RepID=A0A195ESN2_9HYME|nr:hypothetical protein ALC56_14734 [Trachymyrmex septentrionalis]